MTLQLALPPTRRTLQVLLSTAAFVVLAGIAADLTARAVESELLGLRRLTDVDDESSIPTWLNTTLWLLAAAVHALVATVVGRDEEAGREAFGDRPSSARRGAISGRAGWWLVAALCVGLSIDEAAMIHELPIDRLREALDADGLLREAWVIPGAVFCVVVVLVLWPWLRSLTRDDQVGYLLAGAVFVGGSIGVEIVGAGIEDARGDESLGYYLSVSVEEFMEMAGVSLAIMVGLRIAHRRLTVIEVTANDG